MSCGHNRQILAGGEYVCGKCGIVDEELTRELYESMNEDQIRAANGDSHYVVNTSRADGGLGGQSRYFSPKNPGDIFKLGNPYAKDFQKRKVSAPVLQDAYTTMLVMSTNGGFQENGKFKVDYSKDKFVTVGSQWAINLSNEAGLDTVQVNSIGARFKQIYSEIVIGIQMELAARLAYDALPVGSTTKLFRDKNRERIVVLRQMLNEKLEKYGGKERMIELENLS